MTDAKLAIRCPHGCVIEGAYECPDCTHPVQHQNKLTAEQRLHRWIDWWEAVMQPLGVGADDVHMREFLAERFILAAEQLEKGQGS